MYYQYLSLIMPDQEQEQTVDKMEKVEEVKKEEEVDPNSKNIVTRTMYSNGGNSITVYSAPWCGSCNRIKEHFPEILKDYTITSTSYIEKAEYKKDVNDLIPFFVKEGRVYDTVQTSKPDVLKQFVEDNGI